MGNTDSTSLPHALRSLTHHHHCVAHKYAQFRVYVCFFRVRACVCPLLAATPHRHITHFHMVIVRKRITIRVGRPIESPPPGWTDDNDDGVVAVDMVHVTKVLLLFMRACAVFMFWVNMLGRNGAATDSSHGKCVDQLNIAQQSYGNHIHIHIYTSINHGYNQRIPPALRSRLACLFDCACVNPKYPTTLPERYSAS